MKQKQLHRIGSVGCSALFLLGGIAHAQQLAGTPEEMTARLESMKQQLAEQKVLLESLKRAIAEQKSSLKEVRNTVGMDVLATQRGAGKVGEPGPLTLAQAEAPPPAQVGQAPTSDGRPPEVAPIFEQPGVLTPKGKYVLEPSLQFGYSSSNRVALVGYTIIPALLVGLIDVREVKRSTFTAALSERFGITNRLELEVRIPYVYRADTSVQRPIGTNSSSDTVFETSGQAIGDIELGARYQLNNGGVDKPFFIGGLRFKSRTGKDPFQVVTDCSPRCVGTNVTGTGLPQELPTGSGFLSLQPSLTVLFPSDPAVFFGSINYLHNFKRTNISRKVLAGGEEFLGTIEPGDVIGFNFGMGLSLNEKSSFSIGYDHSSVGRTTQNGTTVAGSVRTQLATLLLGYSFRLNERTSLSVSVGAGLTRDTPDVSLAVRLPMTF